NRFGEYDTASIYWVDLEFDNDGYDSLLPYEFAEISRGRGIVLELEQGGPAALKNVEYESPRLICTVLRRKDLLAFLDTTPNLAGNDLDVSRYIRDGNDNDAMVYWRHWPVDKASPDALPPDDAANFDSRELCRVSVAALAKFIKPDGITAWVWDALDGA